MEQINKSTKLLLGFLVLLLLIIVIGAMVFKKEITILKKSQQSLSQENANLKKQITSADSSQKPSSAEATVGSRCDNNRDVLNPNGFQCYFYDSKDSNGNEIMPRHGIWIKQDLRHMSVDAIQYENYIKPWKKYESPDKAITFSYPQNWKVDESNWKNGEFSILSILSIQSDGYFSVSISKIENNAITMEKRINDDKKDSMADITDVELNGSNGIRLDIVPKDNLGDQEQIKFYFQKDKYYIEVNAAKTGYAIFDFPIEYLLSTIKIK